MLTNKKLAAWSFLSLLLVGCVTTTITNLTSTQQPRNSTGQYLIEYVWDSNQQTVRQETITPFVVIGFDNYKMQRVLRTTNRWETYIPVAANQESVRYHFKVDYEYSGWGKPGKASIITPEYKLTIVDK